MLNLYFLIENREKILVIVVLPCEKVEVKPTGPERYWVECDAMLVEAGSLSLQGNVHDKGLDAGIASEIPSSVHLQRHQINFRILFQDSNSIMEERQLDNTAVFFSVPVPFAATLAMVLRKRATYPPRGKLALPQDNLDKLQPKYGLCLLSTVSSSCRQWRRKDFSPSKLHFEVVQPKSDPSKRFSHRMQPHALKKKHYNNTHTCDERDHQS